MFPNLGILCHVTFPLNSACILAAGCFVDWPTLQYSVHRTIAAGEELYNFPGTKQLAFGSSMSVNWKASS